MFQIMLLQKKVFLQGAVALDSLGLRVGGYTTPGRFASKVPQYKGIIRGCMLVAQHF